MYRSHFIRLYVYAFLNGCMIFERLSFPQREETLLYNYASKCWEDAGSLSTSPRARHAQVEAGPDPDDQSDSYSFPLLPRFLGEGCVLLLFPFSTRLAFKINYGILQDCGLILITAMLCSKIITVIRVCPFFL